MEDDSIDQGVDNTYKMIELKRPSTNVQIHNHNRGFYQDMGINKVIDQRKQVGEIKSLGTKNGFDIGISVDDNKKERLFDQATTNATTEKPRTQ